MEYANEISKVTVITAPWRTSNIIRQKWQSRTMHYINRSNNEWRLCKYLGSMLDTGEDIKRREILAITAANQLKQKINPRNKNETIQSICWVYFRLQLQNLDNSTFSSRKNQQCIPAETLYNLCTKRKMAEYRQKWGRIQKNRSHRMEQHHSKTKIEVVWESNQSRQTNTSKEGV